MIACGAAARGEIVGWFAPDYKRLSEAYEQIARILEPITKRSNKMEGIIRTVHGDGHIEFWTLQDESAGRSRKYHKVIIDEAAFTKPNMMAIWERSIEPTLLDYTGKCLVISNTNGIAEDNFLYQICEPDEKRPPGIPGANHGFVEFHATSSQATIYSSAIVGSPGGNGNWGGIVQQVTNIQTLTSKDGTVPCGCFEFGPSTSGAVDASGVADYNAVFQAVTSDPLFGFLCWALDTVGPNLMVNSTTSLVTGWGTAAAAQIALNT
jgi:hypothetical protein